MAEKEFMDSIKKLKELLNKLVPIEQAIVCKMIENIVDLARYMGDRWELASDCLETTLDILKKIKAMSKDETIKAMKEMAKFVRNI